MSLISSWHATVWTRQKGRMLNEWTTCMGEHIVKKKLWIGYPEWLVIFVLVVHRLKDCALWHCSSTPHFWCGCIGHGSREIVHQLKLGKLGSCLFFEELISNAVNSFFLNAVNSFFLSRIGIVFLHLDCPRRPNEHSLLLSKGLPKMGAY